jgi:hypothetical protein
MSATLSGFSDLPNQVSLITLPDGSTVTLTTRFVAGQFGWNYDVSWNGLTPPWQSNGRRLVASPNVLRQFRNVIPFGLTVSTTDGRDPSSVDDLVSGYATLLLLDPVDVVNIEELYFPGNG